MARFRKKQKKLVQNEHERQKADLPKSVGRPKLQEQHRINLLLWLKDQFLANSSIEQISAQLALFNS
jgi:hypothetical protein